MTQQTSRERSACHQSFCQAAGSQVRRQCRANAVHLIDIMPKIKAFPDFSIDRTKVIFADRSISSLSGIDHQIGSPPEKEKSAGGVCNGAAAGERVKKPDPEEKKGNQK